MRRRIGLLCLLVPALALVAAGPASVPPNELVRQANEALSRKQYPEALKLYNQAEERATDPGLVAFNKGIMLYQNGDYADAEAHFRLARQDATGRRQLFATYNLAASILQVQGEPDVAKLAEAVRLFEDCARSDAADERLTADARHNLELAKMLWVQAKARPNSQKQDPPKDDEENSRSQPPKPETTPQPGSGDNTASPSRGNANKTPVTTEAGQEPIKTDSDPTPGAAGNLPVIPDREELAPMSREDAEAHLRQAINKVMQEGRAHRQRSQKVPSGKVRDW